MLKMLNDEWPFPFIYGYARVRSPINAGRAGRRL
jgi:hypothetical protein